MLETYGLMTNIKPASDLHICVMDKDSIGYAQDLAQKTRDSGIKTTVDYSGKRIGDQIKYADKNKIPFITCIGSQEVESGKLKVKELSTGIETEVDENSISSVIIN
jgi:histidyl-tRNA synthetase